ncbi:15085_t:CDS:2 [Funneliformis geosporum]|nr:15085_t:CDS:2 [Funneliformis geosporum]
MSTLSDTDLDEMDEPSNIHFLIAVVVLPVLDVYFFRKDIDDPENKKWVQVKKAIKHCGGVKTCQLAGPNILKASHNKVDLETNPFICENSSSNTPADRLTRVLTQTEYLTAIKTQCPYSNNTFTCDGKAKIKRYLVHTTNQWSEFIGCDKWKQNEKGKDPKSEDDMDCNKLYPSGYHQKYCGK